jgi:hypothetical protein
MWRAKLAKAPGSIKVLVLIVAILGIAVVALGVLSPTWEVRATAASPDTKTTAFVLTSMSDGVGLAPYGDHVVVTQSRQPTRKDLYDPIFAGHCSNGAQVMWLSDKKLKVKCVITDPVVRQKERFQDIEVVYEISQRPAT